MKIANLTLGTLLTAVSLLAQAPTIVLRAGTVLDGKGGASHNRTIVVQGSTIKAIEGSGPAPDYDLRNITLLPGMIDTHVHIAWHLAPTDATSRETIRRRPRSGTRWRTLTSL